MHLIRRLNNFKLFCFLLFTILVLHGPMYAQLSIEINSLGAKPFGTFAQNINRDGFFGINAGLFYNLKKNENISLGIALNYLPYDESTYNYLQLEKNMLIRQSYKTDVLMQTMHGIMRIHLSKNKQKVKPYIDGIIGVNRFAGYTKSQDAFFTGDTNNDGKIDESDGEIDLVQSGIVTDVQLSKASRSLIHSSISPSIGIGVGTKIKLLKSLNADIRLAYCLGNKTSYYDYGSEEIYNFQFGTYNGFKLVESIIPVLFLSLGLSYFF